MRLETLGAALGLKSYGGIPATLGAGGGQTGYKSDIEVNIDTFGVRPPKRNQKEIRSVIESINNKYGSVENIDELRNQDIKRFDN